MIHLINTIIRTLAAAALMLAAVASFTWILVARGDFAEALTTCVICWALSELVGPLPDDRKALIELLNRRP